MYAPLVAVGGYLLVQDRVIDDMPMFYRHGERGPRGAIEDFRRTHPAFEVDHERCERFLITHSPLGWLKRVRSTR
jgi:cephalosporin hydroxylase